MSAKTVSEKFVDDVKSDVHRGNEAVAALANSYLAAKRDQADLHMKYLAAREEVDQARAEAEDLRKRLEEARPNLEHVIARVDILNHKAVVERAQAIAERDQARAEAENLRKQLAEAEATIAKENQDLVSYVLKCDRQSATIHDLSAERDEAVAALERARETLSRSESALLALVRTGKVDVT